MTLRSCLNASSPLAAALAGVALAMVPAHAAPVAVTNDSFEADGLGTLNGNPTGWVKTGAGGYQSFSPSQMPQPTDGASHGWTNGSGAGGPTSLSQIIATELIADGMTYSLTVDIGQLSNFTGSEGAIRLISSGGGAGTALTNANGTAELSGLTPPSAGPYQTVSVSYTALASGDPFAGQSIGVELVGTTGTQVLWDNVRLDASIGDGIAPTITDMLPVNGDSHVMIDADLVATFSEDVQKGTGDIVIKKYDDDMVVGTVDVTTAAVTVDGKDVTINPPSDLPDDTRVYVVIPDTAIKDSADNFFAGISDKDDWNFTTDVTGPMWTDLSPAHEAMGVPAGTNLVVTFDEAVIATAGPLLLDEDFDSDDGGFSIATTAGTAWEHGAPDSGGPGGSVDADNGGSGQCWGINLGDFSSTTTPTPTQRGYYADSTVTCLRSAVIDLTSVAGAELTFAEALDLEAGDTAVVNIIDDTTPAVIAAAIYTATDGANDSADWTDVPAIDLAAGLGEMVRIEWCFTGFGGDSDDYMGWYIDDVQVTETGLPGNSVTIKNLSDATETEIAISDGSQVSVSGDALTIDPASPLDLSKDYAIQIGASAITDLAGNPFAGIFDDTTWNFSTGDGLGPIAVLNPSFEEGAWGGSDTATHSRFNPVHWSTNPSGEFRPRGSIGSLTPTDESFQAWMNNGTFAYQDTGEPIVAGTTYTLKVDLGADQVNFPNIETVVIRLYGSDAGFGTALAEITPTGPTTTQWLTDQTVSFTATAGQATGQTLGVYLGVTSLTQVEWDNVRLDASIGGGGGNDFSDWIGMFPGVGGETGFFDDPDGDGNNSGLENFFGTDPSSYTNGLTAATKSGNTFTFTHPQNPTPADDVSASFYQWSRDLDTFNADGASDGTNTVTFSAMTDTPTPGTTTVTATVTVGPVPDELFVRVGVTQAVP